MNPFVGDPNWGWWIIAYFYLGGLAAGSYFLATIIELWGRDEDRLLGRIGRFIAFPLVAVCGLLLIIDLERTDRFWHMLLQSERVEQALAEGWPLGAWGTMIQAPMLKWWSPMSVGAWVIFIFGGFSFFSFIASLRPSGRLARMLGRNWFGVIFHVLATLVAFFLASYTGVLLAATNQPAWSDNDWTGALFLTSAASTGPALVLLVGRWHGLPRDSIARLETADLWAIALELFVFLIFLASLGGLLPYALRTWEGLILIFGTLIAGLLLPLWLHLGHFSPTEKSEANRASLAAISVLVGAFFARWGITALGPGLAHRYRNGPPNAIEAPLTVHWIGYTFLLATAVLVVIIPFGLRQKWRLGHLQTLAAGGFSLAVLVAVTYLSFTPISSRPELAPTIGMSISPEDQRPRGGGPGASYMNRPKNFVFHNRVGVPSE
jgi:formate-dependent nitrite reductase membrane component NrfD